MRALILFIFLCVACFFGYRYFFAPKTPPKRLAPLGTFYVKEKFSVTTEDGITSLPTGKKVTLVREAGTNLIVTDGTQEFDIPESSLTNDLDILDGINASNANIEKQIELNAAQRSKAVMQGIKKWEDDIHIEQRRLKLENIELGIRIERMNRELAAAQQAAQASLTATPTKTQSDLEQKIAQINAKIVENNDKITDLQLNLVKAQQERLSK